MAPNMGCPEPKLPFKYDRKGDILSIDTKPPYADQDSKELGDGVIARLNPQTDEVENLEILFFSTRLEAVFLDASATNPILRATHQGLLSFRANETRQIDLFAKTPDPAMQDTPLRIEVLSGSMQRRVLSP